MRIFPIFAAQIIEEMNKRNLFWIIPAALCVVVTISYFLLPVFAKSHLQRMIRQFETERNAEITIDELHIGLLHFNGEVPVSFRSALLRCRTANDTLLYFTNVKSTVRVLKGFHRTNDIIAFDSDTITLHLIHKKDYWNYVFLLEGNAQERGISHSKNDYKKLSESILQKIEGLLPQSMHIGTFAVAADIHDSHFNYVMPDATIENGRLHGTLSEQSGTSFHSWILDGTLDHAARSYYATLTDTNGNCGLAIVNKLAHAQLGFRKIEGRLSLVSTGTEASQYCLWADAEGLLLNHRYLATQSVDIDSASAQLQLTVSPSRLTIDSTSVLRLNEAEIHPFVCYEKTKGEKPHITLIINEGRREASRLLGSIPDGLFQVIPDLQLTGKMDFSLYFDCDFREVDSLDLDFYLGSRDRSVRINGDVDRITRFNNPFEYVFFENGDTVRTVTIGLANPHFCPFDQIPPYLTKSILATEDAGFFQHRGFIKSSIREALAADIKAGKLRRGGSTLTMQLVKNLFLNRNKVFSRKIEEMLLVWLIEDYHLISKERMFEIYVNIAEWGPGIIGIGEAADFYFGKNPQELTLGECLYLASLIRAPKHYRNTLDEYGNVIDSKREELIFVARRMVEREFISEDELNRFNSFIHTRCMDEKEE